MVSATMIAADGRRRGGRCGRPRRRRIIFFHGLACLFRHDVILRAQTNTGGQFGAVSDSRYTARSMHGGRSKSMTAQTRGRIRHIALSVKDPWETAEFYKQAVGLEEVMELDGPLAEGVFPERRRGQSRHPSLQERRGLAGHRRGLCSASTISDSGSMTWWSRARSCATSARPGSWATPTTRTAYEVKHTDLNGIIFDIAAHGWVGSQKDPGADGNVVRPNPQRRLAKFDERRTRAHAKFAAMRGKRVPAAAE